MWTEDVVLARLMSERVGPSSQSKAKHQLSILGRCAPATLSMPATMASLLLIIFAVSLITHLLSSVPAATLNELVRPLSASA